MSAPTLVSHSLFGYVFSNTFNHLAQLRAINGLLLKDMTALQGSMDHHARKWDQLCGVSWQLDPLNQCRWPTSKHDFALYILVAFLPDNLLCSFLHNAGLRPKDGTNPLVYAASFDKNEHAQTLLQGGANLNCPGWNIEGSRQVLPLEVALDKHRHAMVELFLAEGSSVPQHIFTYLVSNSFESHRCPLPTVKRLLQTDDFVEAATDLMLEKQPIGEYKFISANHSGAEEDFITIVRRLIQIGCDPARHDDFGKTPLHFAIERGQILVAQYLLSIGIALPSDSLIIALQSRNIKDRLRMVHFLLDNGADVSVHVDNGDSLLHVMLTSLYHNDILEAVKLLIDCGCNPSERNFFGKKPLEIAIEREHISVVQHLLSIGIPLPNECLFIALQSWKIMDKLRMVHFLLDTGADVSVYAMDNGDSPLHVALTFLLGEDALDAVKLLITYGCNPSAYNSSGETPLHVAIEHDHISVIRHLLSIGLTLPSDSLLVALQSRTIMRKCKMIHFLVENRANLLVRTDERDPLLHIALKVLDKDDALDTAKLLISRGCDTSQCDSFGKTLLHIAIERGHASVLQYLLSTGAELPLDSLLVLLQSVKVSDRLALAGLLLRHRVAILDHGNPLHVALISLPSDDALEIVKFLIDRGCNPSSVDPFSRTPILRAIERGHVSVVEHLLSVGTTLPADSLLVALQSQKIEHRLKMVRVLGRDGASVFARASNGDSLLHVALERFFGPDALEASKLFIGAGCSASERNSYGKTPVHIAVERGHTSVVSHLLSTDITLPPDCLIVALKSRRIRDRFGMVRFLVDQGADVSVRSDNGDSPLHITLKSPLGDDVSEAVKLFITRGCNPSECDSSGKTPILIAVEQGYVSVAQHLLSLGIALPLRGLLFALQSRTIKDSLGMMHFLVENGADVLTRADNGDSLLHVALKSLFGDEALVAAKLLISHGCNPLECDAFGKSPLGIAIEEGHIPIAQHLLSIGAILPPDSLLVALQSRRVKERSDMIQFLVNNGADIFVHADNGDPLIHVTLMSLCEDDALTSIKLLIHHGCDPSETDTVGKTPLHIAAEQGRFCFITYLVSISIPLPSDILFSVMDSAFRCLWVVGMLRFLIMNGANVHATSPHGVTLLHAALTYPLAGPSRDRLEIIKLLITSGCDPYARDAAGHTPLYVAIVGGHIDVVEYLFSVHAPRAEDLLSAIALSPPLLQPELQRILNSPRLRDPPPRTLRNYPQRNAPGDHALPTLCLVDSRVSRLARNDLTASTSHD